MTNRMDTDLFGEPVGAQPDLFGDGAPAARRVYVPKPEHVRASLRRLVAEMEQADAWPWPPSVVKRNRDHWLEHLCSLLPDESEAGQWRARIRVQIARLDAAEKNGQEQGRG